MPTRDGLRPYLLLLSGTPATPYFRGKYCSPDTLGFYYYVYYQKTRSGGV